MVYKGRFQNGVIVLDSPGDLKEGDEVEVHPVAEKDERTWAEIFADVIGKAEGLPEDSSTNLDHYLYGTLKK